jgi:hypothetical protein
MFSRRKSLAALTATAALAVAIPAANASAATTHQTAPTVDPQVCALLNTADGAVGSPFFPGFFGGFFGGSPSIQGGSSLSGTLTSAGAMVGCQVTAPQSPISAIAPVSPIG